MDSRALATFGELSRAFGERWRVLAGARYNHDRRTHDWQRTVTSALGVTATADAGRAPC